MSSEVVAVTPAPDYVRDGWLLKQLRAWPSRVDPDRTTNIEALMDFAAVEIDRLTRQQAEARATSGAGEVDLPTRFESWWSTYRHANREAASYIIKKQIGWDAYHAALSASPTEAPGSEGAGEGGSVEAVIASIDWQKTTVDTMHACNGRFDTKLARIINDALKKALRSAAPTRLALNEQGEG